MYGPASGPPGGSNNHNRPGNSGDGNSGPGSGRPRQFTPRGQMAGAENAKSAISDLPPHMQGMFEARPLPQFFSKDVKKVYPNYSGIGSLVSLFEKTEPPPIQSFEAPIERKKRIHKEMAALHSQKLELLASDWDPHSNPKATGDAFCTLFVSRLAYDTNEKKLRREFEQYGNIKSLRLVTDLEGKSRGYAFIEFEREEDLKVAYKEVDRKKIDGKRIVVDVERGRTVRNWRPMRLGGGLGGRKAKKSRKDLELEKIRLAAEASTGNVSSAGAYGRRDDAPRGRESDRGGNNRDREDRSGGGGDRDRGREDGRYGPPPSSAAVAVSTRPRSRSRDRDRNNGQDCGSSNGGDRRPRENSRDRDRDRDRGTGRGRSRDRGSGGGNSDGYHGARR